MFKVVHTRDFVRMKTSLEDHFVITRKGVPRGIYLGVEKMKNMNQEEISDFLFEVLSYLGIFDDEKDKKPEKIE